MSEEKDTVVETTETEPSVDNGTVEEPRVDSSEVTAEEQEKIDRETYEATRKEAEELKKELQKREMELNQRRNKEKELELKALEESGKYKELAETLLKEKEEREKQEAEERAEKEAADYRAKILAEYPEQVRQIAEDLNVWWDGNVESYDQAGESLKAKLDKISPVLSTQKVEEEEQPEVLANNPASTEDPEVAQLRAVKDYKELRKILPKAESR